VIILDTNVISELMKPKPHPAVLNWFAVAAAVQLFTTSINKAEILCGIAALPDGRRRAALARAAEAMFAQELADRILPFDAGAAVHYADIITMRTHAGRPIGSLDAQVAATARAFGGDVATRDISDFTGCGLTLINPWAAPGAAIRPNN